MVPKKASNQRKRTNKESNSGQCKHTNKQQRLQQQEHRQTHTHTHTHTRAHTHTHTHTRARARARAPPLPHTHTKIAGGKHIQEKLTCRPYYTMCCQLENPFNHECLQNLLQSARRRRGRNGNSHSITFVAVFV